MFNYGGLNSLLKQLESEENSDNVFVGDGSINMIREEEEILLDVDYEGEVDEEDDLWKFVKKEEFVKKCDIINVYSSVKEEVYNHYDFFKEKSKDLGNRPIRKRDLLLGQLDYNLIEYLKDSDRELSLWSVKIVSKLRAFIDMGFSRVYFKEIDNCTLCYSFDGMEYDINNLINLYCTGGFLSHDHCECDFIPVVDGKNDGKRPIELEKYIEVFKDDLEGLFEDVIYVYLKDKVIHEVDNKLYVNLERLGGKNPSDYIEMYLNMGLNVIDFEDAELVFYNGKEVLMVGNKFYDKDTKEQIFIT